MTRTPPGFLLVQEDLEDLILGIPRPEIAEDIMRVSLSLYYCIIICMCIMICMYIYIYIYTYTHLFIDLCVYCLMYVFIMDACIMDVSMCLGCYGL